MADTLHEVKIDFKTALKGVEIYFVSSNKYCKEMAKLQYFAIFLFYCVGFVIGATKEVDRATFDDVLPRDKFRLVLFYADWNEDCINVLKVFDKLTEYFVNDEAILIAKADIFKDKKLSTIYRVQDYCSIKFFVKGGSVAESYHGLHTLNDLISLVNVKSSIVLTPAHFKVSLLELQDSNFERYIADKSKDVLVYYYAPWCIKCKNLTRVVHKIAETFHNEDNCIIAQVNGKTEDESIRYSKVASYPNFIFFPRNNKNGEPVIPGKFDENWSEVNLTKFLNIKCDTSRLPQGSLDKTVGRHHELDKLARHFMVNAHRRHDAIRDSVSEIHKMPAFKRKKAHYYVKVMETILTDGVSYVYEEQKRITKLLFGDMALDQRDELTRKKNILEHFQQHHTPEQKRDEL